MFDLIGVRDGVRAVGDARARWDVGRKRDERRRRCVVVGAVVARVGAVVARVGRVGHGRHRVTLPRAMGSSERREDDHARGEVTPSFQRARSREETSVSGICSCS